MQYAEKEGYPIDLVCNIYNSTLQRNDSTGSEYKYETVSDSSKEREGTSIEENEYMKLFSEKSECRKALESKAAAGQATETSG